LLPAPATLYSLGNVNGSGTSLDQAIPVDQYPGGISSSINISGSADSLTSLTVTLNISGGWNGDLYGYLSHNGTLVTLLNFVGTGTGGAFQSAAGYSTSGFNNITLADLGAGGNIHNIEVPESGVSYAPDGGSLSSFNGLNPDGTWTLFLADNSAPDQSTLQGWNLSITAVPEPVTLALSIFGGLLLITWIVRYVVSRRAAPRQQA
jgi:hypothetical protein